MSVYTRKRHGKGLGDGMRIYRERLEAHCPSTAPWEDVAGSGVRDNMRYVAHEFLGAKGFIPMVPDAKALFIEPDTVIDHTAEPVYSELTPTSLRRIESVGGAIITIA